MIGKSIRFNMIYSNTGNSNLFDLTKGKSSEFLDDRTCVPGRRPQILFLSVELLKVFSGKGLSTLPSKQLKQLYSVASGVQALATELWLGLIFSPED